MTRNSVSMAATRTVTSVLAALALTVALPQAASAAWEAGFWKIDPAKSRLSSTSATLTIQRVEGAKPSGGGFIVIAGTGVYRVTGPLASESAGLKLVDVENMTRTGDAVLIGTHPKSMDHCGYRCRAGLPEPVRTVTFRVVNKGDKQIREMLAYENQN